MKNYYQIMEISKTATQDEIKKQYRFLSQAWHPDKFPTPEQKEKAEEKLKEINEAYSILGNSAKRREYDRLTGYQQEPHSHKKPDSKDTQRKETTKRENAPVKSKNRLTGLVVFSTIGILLCVTLLIFSLNNQLSEVETLSTDSVLPTNTNLIPTLQDKVTTLPTVTPISTSTPNFMDGMIFIPAGEFTMGQNNDTSNEKSQLVNLNDFYIDKYEVTNSMYSKCVNAGFCIPPTKSDSPSNPFYFGNSEFDLYPVIYVTWDMANAFCEWREARLPTELEWEKASRGNDGRIYPWGNEFMEGRSNFCDINCPREWSNKDYNDGYIDTAPIGSFPQGQSPYGVFDMSGNVYEWVADSFYPNFTQEKVIRGGAWSDVDGVNATSRATFSFSSAYEFIGFRCASSQPTTVRQSTPNLSVTTTQSVLEQYGYVVASSDSDGAMYVDSCGSQAVWAKNKPKSINFFIPLEYDFCDQTGVVAPIVFSVNELYPASVGDWLEETLQNDEKTTQIILGQDVTSIVDGYKLILYYISDEDTLLFSINAPGEY